MAIPVLLGPAYHNYSEKGNKEQKNRFVSFHLNNYSITSLGICFSSHSFISYSTTHATGWRSSSSSSSSLIDCLSPVYLELCFGLWSPSNLLFEPTRRIFTSKIAPGKSCRSFACPFEELASILGIGLSGTRPVHQLGYSTEDLAKSLFITSGWTCC